MIIQCEQCRTRFKLDDAKVKDKGVKVRCAKCRNVFTVSRDQQSAEKPDFSDMLALSSGAAAVTAAAAAAAPVSFELDNEPGTAAAGGFNFDTSSFDVGGNHDETVVAGAPTFELDTVEAPQAAAANSFDLSTLAWTDEIPAVADNVTATDNFDFSGIAAVGGSVDPDKTVVASSSFTDLGDLPGLESPAPQAMPDLDGFADSIASAEHKQDAAFNLGEIDFGDELAPLPEGQVNPENTDDKTMLFVPLDETEVKTEGVAPAFAAAAPVVEAAPEQEPAPQQEELPPLPIASRRKSSSMMMIILSVVGAALAALLVFMGLDKSADEKPAAQQAGRIVLRSVKATYVSNKTAGDLLVINGEALNSFDAPRAAIQVKGVVFGDGGKVLVSKNAFAGNPISKEQLETMTIEKIEAAMANQFGDSLSNMEIAPGKAIPFVVVISKLPPESKEFAVELVGSTGAAAKK
jgi:predicted Zn finger-like uncharacterized protein